MGEPLENEGRFEFDGAEGIAFWVGNSDEETAVKVMFSELDSLAKFLRFNFPGLFDGTTEPLPAHDRRREDPMSDRFFERVDGVGSVQRIHPHHSASIGAALADSKWREVTVAPVDDLRPDADIIERAARAYDPEAFEDHPIEQRRPLAAIQWGARRHLATEAAQRLAAAGFLIPSGTFASTKPSDAEHLLSVVETIKETGGSVQIRGVLITPCDTYGQPLNARPDADVAERIVRAIEEAAEKHPNPIVRLNLSDAADIARSHATPPFTTEQEIESLAAEIHEAYAYQYDECDHGTYAGGAMHGEPYSMCRINAERIIRRRSNPPVAATGEEVDRG